MDTPFEVEHEDIQKKTFTKWINSKVTLHGQPPVTDLFEDLRDGTRLLTLLEIVTGTASKPEIGRMRVHHLNNVNQALQLMSYHKAKFVNMSSDHIVDGNPKMTLGLVWSIIQRWQMKDIFTYDDESAESSIEKTLLEWCRQCTQGYKNVDIVNLTTSWRDGLAFNALIHHFYPELFDYEMLVGGDNLDNLQHAFKLGHEKLGIVRLLDPEDVNVTNPDRKSIMMYLICCYQVLSRGNLSIPLASSSSDADKTVSVNASEFQNSLETVLVWLLDALDILSKQRPIAKDVQAVKEQFQEHEEFMVRLTVQQSRIGQILQEGGQLLADSKTTDDEAKQVEAQMSLLNSHWEHLRVDAMNRQTSLQQVLTTLQQQQLDRLSDWLTTMESELLEFTKQGISCEHEALQLQIAKHKSLQEAVEKEQEYVSSLQNMVVVVDENNSDEAYVALEKQLESLGLRWGCVCREVEALHIALTQWKNYESIVSELSSWLSRSEQTVANMPLVDSTTDMTTIVEEVRLLKALEGEISQWIPRYDDVQLHGKQLKQTADNEMSVQVENQLQNICGRWDALVQRMEQRSCEIMESGVELTVSKNDQELPIITVSRKYETRIITKTVTLPVMLLSTSKRLQVETIEQSEYRLQSTQDVETTTSGSYQDAMAVFVKWMDGVEELLAAEKVVINETDILEQQLQQLLFWQKDIEDHQKNLEHLNLTSGKVLHQQPSNVDSEKVRSEVQKVQWRWASLLDVITERVSQCHSAIEQVKQFKVLTADTKKWMCDMEEFIKPFTEPFTSVDNLKEQLAESKAVEPDVLTMETSIASIDSMSQTLMELAGPGPFCEKIRLQMSEMNSTFTDIVKRIRSHNELLSSTVQQAQQIIDNIRREEVWIDDTLRNNLQRDISAKTATELSQLETDFKNLIGQISSHHHLVRQVNDEVQNLANCPITMTECEDLNTALTQLNLKWNHLQSQANDANKKVLQFAENYAVFSGLLRDELRWLDQLERKLSAGPRPSGDAEELSEELDELENFVQSQKDGNRAKLTELAESLTSNNFMSASLGDELASYQKRNAALTSQAKQMMVHLEESILQAQNRESRILDMSQWMAEMTELLQSRLDADILAGDVPKEYETLQAEFTQQENLLSELEIDASNFHQQKKLEAAERLEQQIALLKRHFIEVKAKFSKFQRPADFDSKMPHVKRMLDDIDQRLHLIELTSSDLESVQNKLDQCTKFYRTMSEIKSDVEYVIKTGRQIVEKKQVDFPGTLTSQIDAIKQQFNRLGTQVTMSKATLEKAAKLSSDFTLELSGIQSFVDNLRDELLRKEDTKSVENIGDELQWSELMLTEIDQKLVLVTSLDEHLAQFSEVGEDISVAESEQEMQRVSEQLDDVASRLRSWQARLEELSNHLEQMYMTFERQQNELLDWMNGAQSALTNIINTLVHDDNSTTHSQLQKLQSERNQLVTKVDHVRDLAIELINSGKKFERLVEPKLTAFNQCWIDLEEVLKSAINRNTQTVSLSTAVDCKVVRATAALTQLLHENVSATSVQDEQLPNAMSEAVVDDAHVSQELLEMREDERSLRLAVDIAKEKESSVNSYSSQEILNIQSELAVYQSRLHELQQNPEMLTAQNGNGSDVSSSIISLERKIAEIKLYLASVNAAKSKSSQITSSIRGDSHVDPHSVELQVVSPVESSQSIQYEKSSTVTTVTRTCQSSLGTVEGDVRAVNETSAVEMVSMPKLDNFIAKLDKFAAVLSDKARSYPVVIGVIDETEIASQTKKTVEKDLKMMKPQIDAIVSKCETLKSESTSEQYNRLLNDNVNRLYQCWQSAIVTVTQRHQTLDQMLASCRKYIVVFGETHKWIEAAIDRYGKDDIGTDIATIKQQIDILETERLELNDSRNRVDMVVTMARQLMNDYSEDDPMKIEADIRSIDEKWNVLQSVIAEREKALQNAINAMYRFDSDLKNCLLWLTKVEVVLNHHNEMTMDANKMDEEQLNQIGAAVRDLHSEMESQQAVLESLNTTAQKMNGDTDRSSAVSVQSQLDEMNRRWTRLSAKATDIRNRLEMSKRSDPSEEVIKKLVELVQWIAAKAELLKRQRPVAGDIESVRRQLEIVQSMQLELDTKQPSVDECLRKIQTFVRENEQSLARDSTAKINQHIESLSDKSSEVRQTANVLQNELDETLEKLVLLQDALEDLSLRLITLEKESTKWKPIADVVVDDLQHQIDSTLAFQQKVAPTQSEVDHCNDLANQFTDVILSHKNVGRLEDLNKRWLALHSLVETRLKKLQESLRELDPKYQQLLSVSVSRPWERAVANNYVPYYIDHKNETTHWDHPELTRITQSLVGFNNVRFSAYRTAIKLHRLQKNLNFDLVELESVKKVFDSLPGIKSGDKTVIHIPDIINCLATLYEPLTIHSPSSRNVDIPLSIDLVLNWLLNLYDSGRSGEMRVLSFKVAIVLMCNAHYEDKYRSIFRFASNAHHRVDRLGLTALLRNCIQIPKQLEEVAAFGGSNVEPSVQSCFEKNGNQPEILEDQFVDWMKLEPQSMVWIPVMHRVSAAEASRHQARCSVCGASPIVGLRYRCLKCFSFDMCQNCFFSGQTAKSHKLTHPMQEYCGTTTSGEDMRDFTKVVKNRFRSKQYFKKHPRLGYLPVGTVMEGGSLERSISEDSSLRDAMDTVASSNTASLTSTPKEPRNVSTTSQERKSPNQSEQNSSSLEMHSRVGIQAQRLAAVEKQQHQNAAVVDVEDEHSLITQLCQNLQGHKADTLKSPMQIMAGLEADQQSEMESMINELETENRALQAEYDQLLLTHRDPSVHPDPSKQSYNNGGVFNDGHDAELLAEAKQLAKHKTQLEVRLRILEDHNRQLEAQIQRLRVLLDQPEADGAHVVTFTATDRPVPSMSAASSHGSLPRRDPPTFTAYQQSVRVDKVATPVHNGTYSASEQRLISEEEELERMMRELQETFPTTEGANHVDNLFQTVGQVSKAVGTLVNILTVDNEETTATTTSMRIQSQ